MKNTRTLTPQFHNLGNLGEYEIKTVEFTGENVASLSKDLLNALADKVNGQMHITESGKAFLAEVHAKLPARKEEEKVEDYYKRVRSEANIVAAEVGKDFEINFIEAFKTWAVEVYAKRGLKGVKRIPVSALVLEKWKGALARFVSFDAEKQARFLKEVGFDSLPTAEQLDAKYQGVVIAETEF